MANEQNVAANSEWEGNANVNTRDNPVECEFLVLRFIFHFSNSVFKCIIFFSLGVLSQARIIERPQCIFNFGCNRCCQFCGASDFCWLAVLFERIRNRMGMRFKLYFANFLVYLARINSIILMVMNIGNWVKIGFFITGCRKRGVIIYFLYRALYLFTILAILCNLMTMCYYLSSPLSSKLSVSSTFQAHGDLIVLVIIRCLAHMNGLCLMLTRWQIFFLKYSLCKTPLWSRLVMHACQCMCVCVFFRINILTVVLLNELKRFSFLFWKLRRSFGKITLILITWLMRLEFYKSCHIPFFLIHACLCEINASFLFYLSFFF